MPKIPCFRDDFPQLFGNLQPLGAARWIAGAAIAYHYGNMFVVLCMLAEAYKEGGKEWKMLVHCASLAIIISSVLQQSRKN